MTKTSFRLAATFTSALLVTGILAVAAPASAASKPVITIGADVLSINYKGKTAKFDYENATPAKAIAAGTKALGKPKTVKNKSLCVGGDIVKEWKGFAIYYTGKSASKATSWSVTASGKNAKATIKTSNGGKVGGSYTKLDAKNGKSAGVNSMGSNGKIGQYSMLDTIADGGRVTETTMQGGYYGSGFGLTGVLVYGDEGGKITSLRSPSSLMVNC